jgi:hypothetical protein
VVVAIVQKCLNVQIGDNMSWQDTGYSISHARGLGHYELQEMKESVRRCHKLFEKELPFFDTMYLLKILDYGQLQRNYKME